MQKNLYTLASLGLVVIIDSLTMGLIFPLIGPLFISAHNNMLPHVATLSTRDFYYGVTMSVFFLFSILGAPLLGDLSDQLGRKKVLLLCLAGSVVSCLISALAIEIHWVWLLIFARAFAGLMAGSQALAQAAMIDISTPDTKARNISLMAMVSCVGFVIGPLVGGLFSDRAFFSFANYAMPFYIAAVLALINAIALLFTFRETFFPKQKQALNLLKGFRILIDAVNEKTLQKIVMIFFLSQLAWGIYFQFLSLLLTQLHHYSSGLNGIFMAYLGIVFVLALSFVVPVGLKYCSTKQLVQLGLIGVLTGVVMNIFFTQILVQWLSVIPVATGQALVYTGLMTLTSNSVDKNRQGWMMGVNTAAGSFAWGIAALSLSLFSAWHLQLPFIVATLLLCFCLWSLRNYHAT